MSQGRLQLYSDSRNEFQVLALIVLCYRGEDGWDVGRVPQGWGAPGQGGAGEERAGSQ